MVPVAVAQSRCDRRPLWRADHPRAPRALGSRPATHAQNAGVGGRAARARPDDSTAPDRPHRGQSPRPRALRHQRLLRAGAARVLGHVSVAGRRGAGAGSRRGWRSVSLTCPGGRVVRVPIGFPVLEASRHAGLPHASVCGGRGRCSTCRVRIAGGLDALPPPSEAERRVLRRVGAAPDVRLACQLRPAHGVAVVPLLAARDALAAGLGQERQGVEQENVVVFADLRGITRMAEKRLPYDVVYLLNRYFEAVGSAIERAGGIANQFTGDGVMALFGVESGPEAGCRQALAAARGMIAGVDSLSRELGGDLPQPLRLGIGIHVGHAVVGRMGYGDSTYFTAVGDTVHVAARLEQATKDYGCELVISDDVVTRAGLDAAAFPRHEVALRNRAAPVVVRVIERVASLPAASGPAGAR